MANPISIVHRITNAVLKIGTANGTKINEPDYNGEDQSNEARSKWFDEWAVIAEALVATVANSAAEGRKKKAIERLKQTFGPTIAKLKAGDKITVSRGNVSALLDLRNGQTSIDKETMVTILRTEHKWNQEDVIAFMDKITKRGSEKLYTTFSSIQE